MYRFAQFALDPERSVLWLDESPVALAPKVVDTLSALVSSAGNVVAKAELMDRLWPDGFVEESNLTQNIYLLRRTFAAHGLPDAIETLPRRGYRFTLSVHEAESARTKAGRRRLSFAAAGATALLLLTLASSAPVFTAGSVPLRGREAQIYGLGRYEWSLRTIPALHRSIGYFKELLRVRPASALAYSGLSDAYLGLYDYECDGKPCGAYASAAGTYARAAVASDPASAEAHTSLAMVLRVFGRRFITSDAEFRRAIALNPSYAPAHEWYGNSLLVRGRIAAARTELEKAASLDPVAPATLSWLARDAYFAHRYREAVAYAREALAIDPQRHETRALLGLAYEELDNRDAAIATFERLHAPALVAGVYARFSERGKAGAILRRLRGDDIDAALAFIALRDYQNALIRLRRVRFQNDVEHAFYALDPRMDPVRTDPRFRHWTT
jgi:DNA-binding winged helix-turn-helix (wHTH) protein/predicted Zn-dependent protease